MSTHTIAYVAKYGDYLVKIATEHRTTWQAIWSHPLNAEHRRKRGSPDVLGVGDVLHIPTEPSTPSDRPPTTVPPTVTPPWPYPAKPIEPRLPTWECPAGTCQCCANDKFDALVEHSIYLFDELTRRLPNARCRVHSRGDVIFDGHAESSGRVLISLPASAATVFVEWTPEEMPTGPRYPFRKHYTAKHSRDDAHGRQSRLANLGFARGGSRVANNRAFRYAFIASDGPATGSPSEIDHLVGPYHDGPDPLLPTYGTRVPLAASGVGGPEGSSGAGALSARELVKITMPSFQALWNAHPGSGPFTCKKNLGHQCAMKLGHALHHVDPLILSRWANGPDCGDHFYHKTSPLNLITYLGSAQILGPLEEYHNEDEAKRKVTGRKGFIYFEDFAISKRQDHIDLWTDPPMAVPGEAYPRNTRLGLYFYARRTLFIEIPKP